MKKDEANVQVGRFRNKVEFYIGSGETIYLNRGDAIKFANRIIECSKDIEKCSYQDSSIVPKTYEFCLT